MRLLIQERLFYMYRIKGFSYSKDIWGAAKTQKNNTFFFWALTVQFYDFLSLLKPHVKY